jgi:hypothetical protein
MATRNSESPNRTLGRPATSSIVERRPPMSPAVDLEKRTCRMARKTLTPSSWSVSSPHRSFAGCGYTNFGNPVTTARQTARDFSIEAESVALRLRASATSARNTFSFDSSRDDVN